jgi:hypothetical protein
VTSARSFFYDGVEIDNLDDRTGGIPTFIGAVVVTEHLSRAHRWRAAVYMRTWRVINTDPNTRADLATGNEATNLYRGFYGKRFNKGGVLQFAAQQYGVTSPRSAEAETPS